MLYWFWGIKLFDKNNFELDLFYFIIKSMSLQEGGQYHKICMYCKPLIINGPIKNIKPNIEHNKILFHGQMFQILNI